MYQTDDQSLSAVENTITQTTLNLPCSSSGTTTISYSLSAYNGGTIPSWVSINSLTGVPYFMLSSYSSLSNSLNMAKYKTLTISFDKKFDIENFNNKITIK